MLPSAVHLHIQFQSGQELTSLFLKVSKKVISYEDFLLFIKCRTSLWPFGAILKDTFEKNEYFQYLNVENPDMLLEYVRQHENLPYKPIKLEAGNYLFPLIIYREKLSVLPTL